MKTAIILFRRDLRLQDNPAFISACNENQYVLPIYILDSADYLGQAQGWWLHHSLQQLASALREQYDLPLILMRGDTLALLESILDRAGQGVDAVYCSKFYERRLIYRDEQLQHLLQKRGVRLSCYNSNFLSEPWEVKTKQGDYFKVYTHFWRAFIQNFDISPPLLLQHQPQPVAAPLSNSWRGPHHLKLQQLELLPSHPWAQKFAAYWQPGEAGAQHRLSTFIEGNLRGYNDRRDIPSLTTATSGLSPHLHFGEISVAEIWRQVHLAKLQQNCDEKSVERFLMELGWREFSSYSLCHFAQLGEQSCRQQFANFPWENDQELIRKWKRGLTGFPIVDAGMRQLWETGYMHNRVRMIAASFLVKNLLVDWRIGAQWFLETLLDADLASNSMNWQWVAGTGIDSAPYFRIFNPALQVERFDPQQVYIRRWISELNSNADIDFSKPYPDPVIDYAASRNRALFLYNSNKHSDI